MWIGSDRIDHAVYIFRTHKKNKRIHRERVGRFVDAFTRSPDPPPTRNNRVRARLRFAVRFPSNTTRFDAVCFKKVKRRRILGAGSSRARVVFRSIVPVSRRSFVRSSPRGVRPRTARRTRMRMRMRMRNCVHTLCHVASFLQNWDFWVPNDDRARRRRRRRRGIGIGAR